MKLAAQYSRASIIISVSVLLISGVIYFITINHIARQQLDSNLTEEVEEVYEYVELNHKLPKAVDFDEDQTSFEKTELAEFKTRFFDTPYVNPREKKTEEGRAVQGIVKLNGQAYIATIVESRENTEYLIQIISMITLALTAVLLAILVITNRYVLKGLWKPFYRMLGQVKEFNVADTNKIIPAEAKVDEFKELAEAVSKMSSRVISDYQGLKAFTENASHEIMTPLAVIISKLDMLIQDESLKADQFAQINDIYSAANKLSRLNQSLLLLVKIDNDLLGGTEVIDMKALLNEKTQQFHELIRNKKIALHYLLDDAEIKASRYLMDVLINNLFSNAIRHNISFGRIEIRLYSRRLIFKNTGDANALHQDQLFKRFSKGRASEGTGLGLAIMHNICIQHGFELKYKFDNNLHSFEIDFGQGGGVNYGNLEGLKTYETNKA